MAAFPNWQVALLRSLGAPATPQNLRFLTAWQRAEGGGASYNPLNTTQGWNGATRYNSVGVRNYPNAQAGLQATAHTLADPRYQQIVGGLRSGRATAVQLAQSLARSPWGTGTGVLRVLGAGGGTGGAAAVALPSAAAPAQAQSQPNLQPARSALAQQLISNLAPGSHDPNSFAQTIALVSALKKASQGGGPTAPGPAPLAPVAGAPGAAPIRGGADIRELFYDPLGGIKNGKQIGAIGGHGDHVHVATKNVQEMVAAIATARRLGLRVSENPFVGQVHRVHVSDSNHYKILGTYQGRQVGGAIDVSGAPAKMAAYYRWVATHL